MQAKTMNRKNAKLFLIPAILFAVFFVFGNDAKAAEYYLNPASGNDTNDGSISSPWKTLNKIITSTHAGDTVYVRGGSYTKKQYYDAPTYTTQYLLWRSYNSLGEPGKSITIMPVPGETVIFYGENTSYFIDFYAEENPDYPGHYVILKDLSFRNYQTTAIGTRSAKNIVIDNCKFVDFVDGTSGAVAFGHSKNIIIKNSHFENLGIPPTYNARDHAIYLGDGNDRVLVENNIINHIAGFGIHGYGHNDYTKTSSNIIIRKNTVANSHNSQILISASNYDGVYIYGNTLYTTHNPYPLIDNLDADRHFDFRYNWPGRLKHIIVKNNIAYGPVQISNFQVASLDLLNDFYLDNNMWYNSNDINQFAADGTYSYYSFDEFKQLTGTCQNSTVANPLFKNEASFDLTLSENSPARDAGVFLTRTVNAGTGRNIAVEDAGYFHDGFDMIQGDTILVGAQTVVITDIDYAANAISVDRNIAWNAGQSVTLPYSGNAPDIGAYEYVSSQSDITPPSPPSGLSVQ